MIHLIKSALMGALCAMLAAPALASDFPTKPIRLVVPLAPGGGGDLAARVVADKMGDLLKQPIIIENRPGASSVVGTSQVARADADGYTLLFNTDFHAINEAVDELGLLPNRLPYDSLNDFEPVGQVLSLQIILLASEKTGITTMQELVEKAKAAQGGMSAGTLGVGSPHQLAFLLMQQMGDFELLSVPYGGSGPATTAVQGGQVDLAFAAVGAGVTMAESGRVNAIAVSGAKRDPLAPNVPTIAESGFPGFAIESWMGILAPKGVPEERLEKLNSALQEALADPGVIEKIRNAGMTPAPGNRQAYRKLIETDAARNIEILRNANLKVEQ